ncbi:MAG: hypothetical protein RIC04_14270 [Parvibaculum sp.]|uniref:hypothetical protein n=1 Tax=Parvibaculum sp. TaxID=2024848 RepID=UPI0032ED523D
MERTAPEILTRVTSTQIGAIGEAAVASALILGSGGRLAPFRPFADDDGVDLLVFDKVTRKAVPVQVKAAPASTGAVRSNSMSGSRPSRWRAGAM